jgi:hypothetical protein
MKCKAGRQVCPFGDGLEVLAGQHRVERAAVRIGEDQSGQFPGGSRVLSLLLLARCIDSASAMAGER